MTSITKEQAIISELMGAEVMFLDRFGWLPVAATRNGVTVVEFKHPKTGIQMARSVALAKQKADVNYPF